MESGGHVSVSVLHEAVSLHSCLRQLRQLRQLRPIDLTLAVTRFLLLLFWLLGGRGWGESDYSV